MTDDVRKAVETTYSEWLGKSWDDLCGDLAEARAQIALLRKALDALMDRWKVFTDPDLRGGWGNQEQAYYDLAKHAQHQWHDATKALAATPSDCYAKIRAGVLDEAFAALPEENFKFVDRDKIKAAFEKLKQS